MAVNDTIPLRTRRMTPEEVLASLTDAFAIDANHNYGVPYYSGYVHAEMTVRDYCDDMEIIDFRGFLNGWFGLSLTRDQVREIATPAGRRTLREVCGYVAARAEVPAMEPVTVLGNECLSAGAFLAMRSVLARAGADVRHLAPSTPLGPYLRDHFMVFAKDISKLAPGNLPRLEAVESPRLSPWYLGAFAVAIVGAAALVLMTDRQLLNRCLPHLAIAFLVAMLVSWFRQSKLRQNPELPGVRDFRDLVNKLLGRPLNRVATPNLVNPS
jgi:hypothetical protein